MINLKNLNKSKPYSEFIRYFKQALKLKQPNIEAINISTYDIESGEVDSRFVNLKYIDDDKWIFFTNYNSPKSKQIDSHPVIAANLFWSSTNTQIRIKASINKILPEYNRNYFALRESKKNALSISSKQSSKIDSYNKVLSKYNHVLKHNDLEKCPDYWGGYSFTPYYFEFWEGHESRINKRKSYRLINEDWEQTLLQP
jgi:pyridoxamine 5'-phosphate oxidase